MREVSIVIPILNEGDNIKKLTRILVKNLKKIKKKVNYEILFIDDNSSDQTHDILKKIKNKKIKYFIRRKNRDLSKACMYGFDKAKYKIILVMDGDMQHNPKYLPEILELFWNKKLDFLICCRNFFKIIRDTKSYFIKLRTFLSVIITFIFNFLVIKKTMDPMSGFFIFNKKIYLRNKKKLFAKGYKILADLLTVERKNYNIYNFQIKFDSRKKNKSKLSFKILFLIILLILNRSTSFIKNS